MSSSRKKERDRLKRKRKQQELRKRKHSSQFRILSSERAKIECYATAGWREQGIADIVVLKKLPDGSQALGAFLVDLWCLGLKDCWGRLDIPTDEFEDFLHRAEERGTPLEPLGVATARRLVAGGVRFAQLNGFRLPHKYERWVKMLDIDPAQTGVDVSEFGVGGKLRYVGPLDDLARRLIRQPLDEFLSRDDVEVVTEAPRSVDLDNEYDEEYGDEDEYEEEGEDDDFAKQMMEQIDQTRDKLADAARRWCFANNQVPSPAIPDAIEALFASLLQLRSPLPEGDESPSAAAKDETLQHIAHAMESLKPQEKVELGQALDQVQGFMASFKSPLDMLNAVGMDEPAE